MNAESQKEITELFAKVASYAHDPRFRSSINQAIRAHEALLEKVARDEAFADKIRNAAPADTLVTALLAAKRGALFYDTFEFVPDVYQGFENHGLVTCEYGHSDGQGRRTRTIRITDAGLKLAESLDS